MLSYLLLPLLLVVLGFGILRSRHWTGFWALMFLYYAFFAVLFVAMLAMLLTIWVGRDPRLLASTALEERLLRAVAESGFEVLLLPVYFSLLPLGVAWLLIGLRRMLRRLIGAR